MASSPPNLHLLRAIQHITTRAKGGPNAFRRTRPSSSDTIGSLLFEERLIYFPSKEIEATPEGQGLDFREVFLVTSDETRIHGWFLTARPRRSRAFTLLFCHGNAGNISGRLDRTTALQRRLGMDVFLFDYRGFGRSEGAPSEEGTYRDAVAAHRYLVEGLGIAPERVILFGESLGAAVAIEL